MNTKGDHMDTLQAIRTYLRAHSIPFREIGHAPAASASEYQETLGTRLEQQAKCLLVTYHDANRRTHAIVTIQAQKRADLKTIGQLLQDRKVRLAPREELTTKTGCNFGELPPIASLFGLPLVFDRDLLDEDEIYFNAGRLDRSMAVPPRKIVRSEDAVLF